MSRSNPAPRAMSLDDLRSQLAVAMNEWRDAGGPVETVVSAIEDLHAGPTRILTCIGGCGKLAESPASSWLCSYMCADCEHKYYPVAHAQVREKLRIGQ